MKITTRFGDKGKTKFGEEIKYKSEPIFELLGGLDEVQANLGVCYEIQKDNEIKNVMNVLYKVMGSIFLNHSAIYLQAEIEGMEFFITTISERYNDILTGFTLPEGSAYIAQLHVARVVTRRIERLFVRFQKEVEFDTIIISYLNRLSDWLYAKTILKGEKNYD